MQAIASSLSSTSPNTDFARALSRSANPAKPFFSRHEKVALAIVSAALFSIPILASAAIVRATSIATTLPSAEEHGQLSLNPISTQPVNDEVVMVEQFIDKASLAAQNPEKQSEVAGYLNSAQALLAAIPEDEQTQVLASQIARLASPQNEVQRIAAPASSSSSDLQSEVQSNSDSHTVTMSAGNKEMRVEFPLGNNTQVYLAPVNNRDNAVIFVKQKEAGVGFTLSTLRPLTSDLVINWYEIKEN